MNRPIKASELKLDQKMPRLEDISGEFAKLQSKKLELLAESQRLQAILMEPEEIEDKSRVAQLLGDIPPVDENKLRARAAARAETEAKLNDLQQALSILDRRIGEERLKASDEICRRIEPHYKSLVHDLCAKLVSANEANRELHEFMAYMNSENIAWGQFNPIGCRVLGSPTNSNNPIMQFLRLALQGGFITAAEVSPEVLTEWAEFQNAARPSNV